MLKIHVKNKTITSSLQWCRGWFFSAATGFNLVIYHLPPSPPTLKTFENQDSWDKVDLRKIEGSINLAKDLKI